MFGCREIVFQEEGGSGSAREVLFSFDHYCKLEKMK
jgi:hypothetical protein